MKLKIYIAKCPITVTDTMYFSNKEEQDAYFSSLERLEIEASYNGARDFKIFKNYLSLINSGYNYMYFEYENRWWYTFIDEVYYVNDTVCGIKVTTDFIQTFMFDVKWSKSRVCNRTYKKADFIGKNITYDNMFPISNDKYEILGSIKGPKNFIGKDLEYGSIGFMVITLNKSCPFISNMFSGDTDNNIHNFTWYEGKQYPFVLLYIPIKITEKGVETSINISIKTSKESNDVKTLNYNLLDDLIDKISAYIVDYSIITQDIGFSTEWSEAFNATLLYHNDSAIEMVTIKMNEYTNFYCYTFGNHYKDSPSKITKSFVFNTNDIMLLQKYFKIFAGTRFESNEISFNDFILSGDSQNIDIDYVQSLIVPFKSIFRIKINNNGIMDKIKMFSLNTNVLICPYEVSAWAEYYSNNMASVNDGLQTKHKYEEQISKNNMTTKGVTAGVGMLAGVGMMFNPATVASGAGLAMASATSLANGVTTYENEKLNREKERALLEIAWNDIKSSPSSLNNLNSDMFCYLQSFGEEEYENTSAAIIAITYPANLDDIREFHKIYGFATHKVEDYSHETLKKHTVFDYISFDDPILTANLPKDTIAIIKEIYRNGIRFWYSIDTFLNYSIENEEV